MVCGTAGAPVGRLAPLPVRSAAGFGASKQVNKYVYSSSRFDCLRVTLA